jgi:hypothetical protein
VVVLTKLLLFESIAPKNVITKEVHLGVIIRFGIADIDKVKHRRLPRFSVNGSSTRLAFASPGRWNLSPSAKHFMKFVFGYIVVVVIFRVFMFDVRIEIDNDTPIKLA